MSSRYWNQVCRFSWRQQQQKIMILQVWGISTEDMDALTFGTPRLIRNLMAAASQKLPINVYEYKQVRPLCSLPDFVLERQLQTHERAWKDGRKDGLEVLKNVGRMICLKLSFCSCIKHIAITTAEFWLKCNFPAGRPVPFYSWFTWSPSCMTRTNTDWSRQV